MAKPEELPSDPEDHVVIQYALQFPIAARVAELVGFTASMFDTSELAYLTDEEIDEFAEAWRERLIREGTSPHEAWEMAQRQSEEFKKASEEMRRQYARAMAEKTLTENLRELNDRIVCTLAAKEPNLSVGQVDQELGTTLDRLDLENNAASNIPTREQLRVQVLRTYARSAAAEIGLDQSWETEKIESFMDILERQLEIDHLP